MPTDPTRRHRGPAKDRFRAARRAKERADRKFVGPQLLFPWFEDPTAPAVKIPHPGQTGRAAT
jgi:hypothetical protein